MIDDGATPTDTDRRGRRVVLWGVLAVLAVGVGAIAVVAGTGSDGDALSTRRLPIALDSGTAGAETRSAAPAADMAMLAYVHYTAGDDLPTLGGEAHAYRLRGEVDLDALGRVARALGVEGEPKQGVDAKDSWTIESGDQTLSASEYGGGSWWYSRQSAQAEPGCEGGPDQTCSSPAFDPGRAPDTTTTVLAPPADLPSTSEAEQIARDLFADMGVELAGADVSVEGPYEAWYVNVTPRIGGLPVSGYGFTASVGPRGEILNAAGILATPEDLGSYPTIDTRKAIDRLNDRSADGGSGAGGRELAMDTPAVAPADAPITSTTLEGPACPPDDGSLVPPCPSVPPSDPNLSQPETPPQPPTPIEVVLHRAERVLVLIGASDGSSDGYLVPGYRMTGDDGTVVDVASVDDEALLPTPTTVAPDDHGAVDPDAPVSGPGSAGGAAPADQ
jgi:hypothetical protein